MEVKSQVWLLLGSLLFSLENQLFFLVYTFTFPPFDSSEIVDTTYYLRQIT